MKPRQVALWRGRRRRDRVLSRIIRKPHGPHSREGGAEDEARLRVSREATGRCDVRIRSCAPEHLIMSVLPGPGRMYRRPVLVDDPLMQRGERQPAIGQRVDGLRRVPKRPVQPPHHLVCPRPTDTPGTPTNTDCSAWPTRSSRSLDVDVSVLGKLPHRLRPVREGRSSRRRPGRSVLRRARRWPEPGAAHMRDGR